MLLTRELIKLPAIRQWILEYNAKPYLSKFSDADLIRVYESVRYNVKMMHLGISTSHKIQLVMTFVHVVQEFRKRNLKMSCCKRGQPEYPQNYQSALLAFESGRYKSFFVKYGRAQHMKDLFDNGKIWIRPASYYKTDGLTSTQQDEECIKKTVFDSEGLVISSPKIPGQHKILSNLEMTSSTVTDYWLYSLSSVFDVRLFCEYCKTDDKACVIIKEPSIFFERVIKAFMSKIPFCTADHGGIKYTDVINSFARKEAFSEVFFTKDFRYSFEREYRIAWIPMIPIRQIEDDHIEIEIGSCKDCCDLIVL